MPKSRKFIEKKNAVTFHLVHRSQQDPLAADEDAPQRVLLPAVTKEKPNVDKKKRLDEQTKFGVFYDDDYNYLQHLREANPQMEWEEVAQPAKPESKIKLPSSVFASTVEEDVGLLNKAAPHTGPRPDLDPDIVAAMDEDFDYEDPDNELEDNFIELANQEGLDNDEGSDEYSDVSSDFCDSDEERDEVGSLNGPQYTFADEETKSRFTEYSMSSSVMRRNEQLTLLDDRFEKMYSGYDEAEIGALDCEEIQGHVTENADILLRYAEEFERDRKLEQLEKDEALSKLRCVRDDSNSDDEDDMVPFEVKDERERWDCESILSTYSNIYNHPKLIPEPRKERIKIDPHTGIPKDILGSNKLTAKSLAKFNEQMLSSKAFGDGIADDAQSTLSKISMLSVRDKNEDSAERKARKKALREYRKERRVEKKANVEAFKEETKRQVKITLNNRNNIQGNRIL